MNVEFVRFKASDDVELQGWLSRGTGDQAVLHIHGMGGNGYENYFLDTLRDMYLAQGISFFSIDTRGRGIVSDFRQGDGWKHAGSCYEIFEESMFDIVGALDYLRSQGYGSFILQGHSLGCSKIVNYLVEKQPNDVKAVILIAPTDMIAWAGSDPDHADNLAGAKKLLLEGRGEELVGAQCWPLDKTPLSAQAYVSKSDTGTPVDIYGVGDGGVAPLGKINVPVLIPYGTNDIGITHPFKEMETYRQKLDNVKNPQTQLVTIEGSGHGFIGYEDELAGIIKDFLSQK